MLEGLADSFSVCFKTNTFCLSFPEVTTEPGEDNSPSEPTTAPVNEGQEDKNKEDIVKDGDSQGSSLEDFVKTTVESAFSEAFPSLEVTKDTVEQETPESDSKESEGEKVDEESPKSPCENAVSIKKETTDNSTDKEDDGKKDIETEDKEEKKDRVDDVEVISGESDANATHPDKKTPETKMKKSNSFLPWKKTAHLDSDKQKEHKQKSSSLPAVFRRSRFHP